ncbi:hypothetical protein OUZ56_003689 [Daphnia magna]|uniref:Uncharacterized protein n=1 Tax=Daphnia magna TaxID=35525 RepID=A0ABR0A9H0_9CRUS|nr:hypothetical protein OUZ56_003689 [Daphnia magna]
MMSRPPPGSVAPDHLFADQSFFRSTLKELMKLSGTKPEQSEENRGFGWKLSGTKAEQSKENRKFGWYTTNYTL